MWREAAQKQNPRGALGKDGFQRNFSKYKFPPVGKLSQLITTYHNLSQLITTYLWGGRVTRANSQSTDFRDFGLKYGKVQISAISVSNLPRFRSEIWQSTNSADFEAESEGGSGEVGLHVPIRKVQISTISV